MSSRLFRPLSTLALGLSIWLAVLAAGSAATASNWKRLTINEDSFYNYDNLSQSARYDNVDWPVNMLFYNNAEVDKVKGYYWGTSSIASAQNLLLYDGYQWEWDTDKGTKDGGCFTTYKHMRLYAPSHSDRMYNTSWGYYVLGTTHIDDFECGTIAGYGAFGWSEDAEGKMAQRARDKGLTVYEDYGNFYNYEADRWEDDHFWQNNGMTTYVRVP